MRNHTLLLATLICGSLAAALPACSSARPDSIPASAVESGSGKGDVAYLAGDPGTVYIYDRTWNQLIYSGPVERGQMVKIDTAGGRVLVNGKLVSQHQLGGDDEFSIYVDTANIPNLPEEEWRSRRASDMP